MAQKQCAEVGGKRGWQRMAVALLLMFIITIAAGAYGAAIGKSEMVHFWVAFPAGNVAKPMVLRGPGPPISLSPVTIDLDSRGALKNLLNPNFEAISTHWIYNYGKKPVRVKLELVNCSIPVRWEVGAGLPYDPETRTFTEPLMPGKSISNLGIDWIFEIPPNYMYEAVIYKGGLQIIDADNGQVLTFIPIEIVRGGVSSGGGSCCG